MLRSGRGTWPLVGLLSLLVVAVSWLHLPLS